MSSITIPVETRFGRTEWSIASDDVRGCDLDAHTLGQQLTDEVIVQADISYGPYVWCGTVQQECLIKDAQPTVLVVVKMVVPSALTKYIRCIRIFGDSDSDRFCYRYTTEQLPLDPVWTMSFTMPYRTEPTPMRVAFCRAAPQVDQKPLSFTPMQIIVEKKFVVSLAISREECPICLESIEDDKNLFISRCGHALHNKCLSSYLETNKLLLPELSKCKFYHQEPHFASFVCPMCRTKVISSVKINCY